MDLIVGQLSERKEEYNQFDEFGAALSTCQKNYFLHTYDWVGFNALSPSIRSPPLINVFPLLKLQNTPLET